MTDTPIYDKLLSEATNDPRQALSRLQVIIGQLDYEADAIMAEPYPPDAAEPDKVAALGEFLAASQ